MPRSQETHQSTGTGPSPCIRPQRKTGLVLVAVLSAIGLFEAAYAAPLVAAPGMIGFAFAVAVITANSSSRVSFYSGLLIGTSLAAIELQFMATIFGASAVALWLILGLWTAILFLIVRNSHACSSKYSPFVAAVVWIGVEYFRSELYHLRFSWVTPGLGLVDSPWHEALRGGQYLASGVIFFIGFCLYRSPRVGAVFCIAFLATAFISPVAIVGGREIVLAGIQIENPDEDEIPQLLTRLNDAEPQADILVMSEYTLLGGVPDPVLRWCDQHDKHLIIGGRDELEDGQFYNTAFVVGPEGTIVFRQAKSVPIQFFSDGLPAPSQNVWQSPYGDIALPICYDLSYTRVINRYVSKGACVIVNPTMDAEGWGEAQHRLHARIPKCRALEYGVPVFRLASSGISLAVEGDGRTVVESSFPGQSEIVAATLTVPPRTRLPLSRWLGPLSVGLTIGWILWLLHCHRAVSTIVNSA